MLAIARLCAAVLVAGAATAEILAAVQHETSLQPPARTAGSNERITAWTREVVGAPQFAVLSNAARGFNNGHPSHPVVLLPSIYLNYEAQVRAAAAAGTLPCLLEIDSPFVAEFAWSGALLPLDQMVPKSLLDDLLPSVVAQGQYAGRLYSLGQYESGLALWANKQYLSAAGVRIATVEAPWTLQEFEAAMHELSKVRGVEYPLNLDMETGSSEFYSYAFGPLLQAFGGDLIDRTKQRATGVLDGPNSVTAMKHFQSWFQRGWTRTDGRHNDFEERKSALSWSGHWFYSLYRKALGSDLVLMPLPNFARGIRTGMGSWSWAISSSCPYPAEAWSFIARLMSDEEVMRMTNANSAIPARRSTLRRSALYGPHGPLAVFAQQLNAGYGVPRPKTPAYETIRDSFRDSVRAIAGGADVQTELHTAAQKIDQEITTHRDYPDPWAQP